MYQRFVFRVPKDRLLASKRPSFRGSKTAFYSAKDRLWHDAFIMVDLQAMFYESKTKVYLDLNSSLFILHS